jgi:hypothetical protein
MPMAIGIVPDEQYPMVPRSQDRKNAVATLAEIASGYFVSQALFVAVKLGIADLLAKGPQSSEELARAAGAHADSLHRILRVLAGSGVFGQEEDGRFVLTPAAQPLRSDAPDCVSGYLRLLGSDWYWRAWGELLHTARSGEPAFEYVFKQSIFDYLTDHPGAGRIFSDAMTSRSAPEDAAIADAMDLAGVKRVVDVGGGQGGLIMAVLRAHPHVNGILFDLPNVVAMAQPRFAENDIGSRCEFAEGDFFSPIWVRADAVLMKRIIHDWDDERAKAILTNCRQIVPDGGKLILIERLMTPGNDYSVAKLMDLQMMVITPRGRERSESEYSALFAATGFSLPKIVPTVAGMNLIVATAV